MPTRRDILKAEELFARKQLREECVFWAAITVAMSCIVGLLYFFWG